MNCKSALFTVKFVAMIGSPPDGFRAATLRRMELAPVDPKIEIGKNLPIRTYGSTQGGANLDLGPVG